MFLLFSSFVCAGIATVLQLTFCSFFRCIFAWASTLLHKGMGNLHWVFTKGMGGLFLYFVLFSLIAFLLGRGLDNTLGQHPITS